MSAAFRIGYQRLKKWFNPVRRKQLSVFLTCLAISFFLWLLIRLSENVSSSIEYPVVIEDIPKGLALTNQSDTAFTIRVDSRGWNMIRLKNFRKDPDVSISLMNLRLNKYDSNYYASIPTRGIEERIAHELEVYNNMLSLTPDTLYLTLEKITQRRVPVVADIDFTPDDQFYLYDSVTIFPRFMTIKGVYSALQKIDTIFTEPWHSNAVRGPQHFSLAVTTPTDLSAIELEYDSIRVTIPVEQYTEAVITVPVYEINNASDKAIKIFPDVAEIRYLVALKDYSTVQKNDFRLEAVCKNEATSKLPVHIAYFPEKCIITSINPEYVEYIVIK